ncbi:MAG: carboxylesterase family protein, partial [Deltaproteobacteria bacterium]|nr:carboxylesterase family protein [Deltaproteobacteria bacterium]
MNSPLTSQGPVRIDSGLIKGAATGTDKSISVYKGIPYSAPPIGEMRWRPPESVTPWKGVRSATEYGPSAPQAISSFGGITERTWQSEDCLYLNIWTPAAEPDEKLPVMVWLHGGAFSIGSGSNPQYAGMNLARKGVVLVTINYRLNYFGPFAHPLLTGESEHHASGNYGLMDQVAALRWVQRNICRFGGDPDCVTIFGESAGSRSVTLLMVSPLAEGLFHRGICQSGATRDVSQSREEREEACRKLAEKVGAETLQDLRAKTWDEFASAGPFNTNPLVDGWVIPGDPRDLYAQGKQHDVPLIIGSNLDEATLFILESPIKTVEDYKRFINRRYKENADRVLGLYPVKNDGDVHEALNRHATDAMFTLHARKQARWMEKAAAKTYLYHFTRIPPTSGGEHLRAHHGAEIAYAFGNMGPGWGDAAEVDRALSDAMMTYWTQFAATGDPNADGLPDWPAYETETDQYLELGEEIKAGSNLRKKELDVLDK